MNEGVAAIAQATADLELPPEVPKDGEVDKNFLGTVLKGHYPRTRQGRRTASLDARYHRLAAAIGDVDGSFVRLVEERQRGGLALAATAEDQPAARSEQKPRNGVEQVLALGVDLERWEQGLRQVLAPWLHRLRAYVGDAIARPAVARALRAMSLAESRRVLEAHGRALAASAALGAGAATQRSYFVPATPETNPFLAGPQVTDPPGGASHDDALVRALVDYMEAWYERCAELAYDAGGTRNGLGALAVLLDLRQLVGAVAKDEELADFFDRMDEATRV